MSKLGKLFLLLSTTSGGILVSPLGRGRGWCGMTLALALAFAANPARAEMGTYWQCVSPSSSNPQGTFCPTNQTSRLPTYDALGGVAAAGSQVGVVITSAAGLTVPVGTGFARIQAQGTNNGSGICLFWRDDGSDPTGTAGQALAANSTLTYAVSGLPFRMIAATGATCTASISYYK